MMHPGHRGVCGLPITTTANNNSANSSRSSRSSSSSSLDMFCFRRHTDILPLIDIFDTPNEYVLHVDAPGARAEDLCANWEPETRNVRVTGLWRRHGDKVFLATRYGPEERLVGP